MTNEEIAKGIVNRVQRYVDGVDNPTDMWLSETATNLITQALADKDVIIKYMVEALGFYSQNAGLFIDHKSGVFRSSDSDEKDFHGKLAREILAKIKEQT